MTPQEQRRRTLLLLVGAVLIGVSAQLVAQPAGLAAWSTTSAMAVVAVGALATLRNTPDR